MHAITGDGRKLVHIDKAADLAVNPGIGRARIADLPRSQVGVTAVGDLRSVEDEHACRRPGSVEALAVIGHRPGVHVVDQRNLRTPRSPPLVRQIAVVG